jgi:polysaccharide biosynthesis protein PelD
MTTPPNGSSVMAQPGGSPRKRWTVRRTAIVEIGLFLVLVLVVDRFWGHGDRFAGVEPHPFWAIVLLMAVQYGTSEALLATAASTVALLAGHLPAQTFDQDVHQYALQVLSRPLLWMVASVILGELRGRHRQKQAETSERLRDAERQVALLSQGHAELSATKARLETRLAGQLRTAAGVLDAGRKADALDPAQVLAGATDLLRTALNAKACSLFLLSGDALTLAAADGWSEGRAFAERHGNATPLFQEIVGAQRYVSVASPDGERVLQAEGLMAGPLVDPSSGTLFGMLKVEEMGFLDFNLSSVQTFRAVCTWIAAAYGKALAHRRSQIEDETTHLYSMTYFDRQTAYLTQMARRFGFDLTLLLVHVQGDEIPDAARQQLPAVLGEVSRRVLRGTDLLFSHQPPGMQFAVLLPGATADGAVVVARKLVGALRDACGFDVACTTQVRALCAAGDGGTRRGRSDARPGQVA